MDGDGVHLSEREKMALSFGVEMENDGDFIRFNQRQTSMDIDSDGESPVPRGFQSLKLEEDQIDEQVNL